MPRIAVFDTNVFLSGIGWRGSPYRCLELTRAGDVQGVTCPGILSELAHKLDTKLTLSPDDIPATLADLLSYLRVLNIAGSLRMIEAGPDDDKVLECPGSA